MRKIVLSLAILSMVLLAALPVAAQDQEAESGDVDQSYDVSGSGDNSNQCVGIQGTANTGNAQNQVILEFPEATSDAVDNDLDGLIDELDEEFFEDLDVDEFVELIEALEDFNEASNDASVDDLSLNLGDATVDVSPSNVTECAQSVDQEAVAVSAPY